MRVVMKFGGTSVGSADAICQVAQIVRSTAEQHQVVPVISAMNAPDMRTTDMLIGAAQASVAGDTAGAADALDRLLRRHLQMAAELATPSDLPEVEQFLRSAFAHMADLSRAIAVLGELSPRSAEHLHGGAAQGGEGGRPRAARRTAIRLLTVRCGTQRRAGAGRDRRG